MQAVFRSVNRLLLDTATSEYLFCCDFFSDDGAFMDLFQPTLAMVEAALAVQLQVRATKWTHSVTSLETLLLSLAF